MVKIGKLLSRERLVKALKSFGALRFRVSHSSLVVASLLSLILLLAFLIRILPMRWGTYLSEFDPYFQYRMAKNMVEDGFFSWASWHDSTGWPMSWYPYGRNVPSTSYPGLPFTAASLYLVSNALGVPITLLELCVVFPAVMAVLTCLVMFFLGKDFGGKMVGLFSALFLALNASYIGRTSWGFFDDETVGIFALLLFMFFFLRSVETERSLRGSLTYALAAGLSLGYLFASWGAARYPMGMAIVFVFALLLFRRYSSRLLFSYSTTFGIALFMAVNVPRLGFGFLSDSSVLAALGVFVLLCAYAGVHYIKTTKMKTVFVLVFFAFCAFSFLMLSWLGYVSPLTSKYVYVLNPATRPAFVQSVQEHRPAAWGSLYYDLGIGAFFIPVGLFFAVRNPTDRNVFLIIFGLTSIYFAGSMIRLTLLLAPAVSLLWALALVQLLRPFITILKEVPAISRRKRRFAAHVGKEFSGALLIVMFLLLTFTLVLPNPRFFGQADTPPTIAAASIPVKPDDTTPDWIDTLAWMRENLPPDAVVASWWDYGYWITVWGNKTSLADNGTFNTTQIAEIGYMFMSNETEAIKVFEKFNRNAERLGFDSNVSHVLVFTTFDTNGQDVGFGDEGKWRWMARIAASRQYPFVNETEYGVYDEQGRWAGWSEKGQDTVIYKLMTYGKETRLGSPPSVTLTNFDLAYFSKGDPIQGQVYALVCIYEVKYD
ncbi:MAG: hypothetical protein OEW95_01125 [Candidatus Bathyarchaeota archaeon]|nr:hypothetical protein [Candidatus Bathyarchaeota archaeon]